VGHVILLHPHHGHERENDYILPLNLLYVAAPIVDKGFEVTAMDQRLEPNWRDKLRAALKKPDTLCVGISAMTGPQITFGIEMAKIVREEAPGLPIVWGGVHCSLLPEQTAEHDLVDIVCMGEGEASFPPLVEALSKGEDPAQLPGVCMKLPNGEIIKNEMPAVPDLEKIPPLPYDLFNLDDYKISPLRSAGPSLPMVSSRGCRFRCAYCYIATFQQRRWRGLSPEKTVAEMRRLKEEFNAEGVFFLDDYFFQEKKRAQKIMELLVEEELNLNIYNANARIDFLNRVDMDFLHLMRKSGIQQLFIGAESGSPQVLKDMLKDIKADHIPNVNRKLYEADISPVYSFMAGMPGETEDDIQRTLELMIQLKDENPLAKLYKVCIFVPFPGTEYFERAKKMGNKFPERFEDWGDYDYDHINLSYLSKDFRQYLERVSALSAFIDVDGKIRGVLAPAVKAYSKVARWRCRTRNFKLMPEMHLINFARYMQRA